MDNNPTRKNDDEPPAIADAAGLFGGDEPAPSLSTPSEEATPDPIDGDAYDLMDGGGDQEQAPSPAGQARPPRVPPPLPTKGQPPKRSGPPPIPKSRRDPDEAVQQVWTRSAEWGPTLVVVGLASAGVLILTYLLLSADQFGLAFLVLALGGIVVTFLAYPIFVTLERPVRVTPEQAARDFYNSLSHHFPQYRRMWLLLSQEGRVCTNYGSYEGFKSYWKARVGELKRGGRASVATPLKFMVVDFKAAKSAGETDLPASFTVNVLVRGRQEQGPVESFRVQTTLVKGPDRMWYLDRGTLP